MKSKLGAMAALKAFFGLKPEQTLREFAEEVRQLSPDEKRELAQLAAAELGIELEAE